MPHLIPILVTLAMVWTVALAFVCFMNLSCYTMYQLDQKMPQKWTPRSTDLQTDYNNMYRPFTAPRYMVAPYRNPTPNINNMVRY
jgi:hypothetical protein